MAKLHTESIRVDPFQQEIHSQSRVWSLHIEKIISILRSANMILDRKISQKRLVRGIGNYAQNLPEILRRIQKCSK